MSQTKQIPIVFVLDFTSEYFKPAQQSLIGLNTTYDNTFTSIELKTNDNSQQFFEIKEKIELFDKKNNLRNKIFTDPLSDNEKKFLQKFDIKLESLKIFIKSPSSTLSTSYSQNETNYSYINKLSTAKTYEVSIETLKTIIFIIPELFLEEEFFNLKDDKILMEIETMFTKFKTIFLNIANEPIYHKPKIIILSPTKKKYSSLLTDSSSAFSSLSVAPTSRPQKLILFKKLGITELDNELCNCLVCIKDNNFDSNVQKIIDFYSINNN